MFCITQGAPASRMMMLLLLCLFLCRISSSRMKKLAAAICNSRERTKLASTFMRDLFIQNEESLSTLCLISCFEKNCF
ncbi:hypothetical protein MANES_17G085887v8 [Manihot esculenta]|uniref:Uncharacterized protein n=1 Tax=Manihot esculenta TaxID=3983 RepID=A0ACB7G3K1_MANES|nr:hypothetical protein MANES_17G085887v8 [Manihot esculenta]